MALQGNLRDFSVTEILSLLGTQKKYGCLTLEWNTETHRIYMIEGRIVATRQPGMPANDPLLRFLLKVKRLSDEQCRGLLAIHRESGRDLEDLLVNGRYMEADELQGYLERQILDDMMRIVRWENGAYRFNPDDRWPHPPSVRLSMEGGMIEAARRADEHKRFVQRFKDPYEILAVYDLPDDTEAFTAEEKELFGIVNGQRTVAEIIDAAPLLEYEVYEALHRLLEAGWIVPAGRRDPGDAGAVLAKAERPRATQVSWLHEILVPLLVLGAFAGLQFGGRWARESLTAAAPASDAFVRLELSEIQGALASYHREVGSYPPRLQLLGDQGWLDPRSLSPRAGVLRYQPTDGQAYTLEFQPDR